MYILKRFTIFIIVLAASFAGVAAQEVSFSVVPPQQAFVGRNFIITYRVVNAQVSAPGAPNLPGCQYVYGPSTSTMQSMQFSNGVQTSMTRVDYSYTYVAEKAGKVTIPAATINVNGKTYSTSPTTFTVLPADKSSQNQPQRGNSNSRYDEPRTIESAKVSPNDLIVKVILSKSSVYEQEPVIATVKLYTRHDITDFSAKVLPKFEGFLSEELPVTEQPKYENYNGQNYVAAVLKKCILYPQKSGTLSINSGTYDVTIEQYETVTTGFFVTRRPVQQRLTTTSAGVTLNVKPLPTPAPAGFNGAVGQFTASTTLSPEKLKTNEPVNLKLQIKGTGNLSYLTAPSLQLPAGIESLNPQTDISAKFNGSNMAGSYTVDYTLLPQDPGKYSITAGVFSYFDPSSGQYHTIELPTYKIFVEQGAAAPSGAVEQNSIAKTMTDIYHIKPSGSVAQSKGQRYIADSVIYWLVYLALIVSLVAIIILYRRNLKLNADIQGKKLARANKVAAKRLRQVRAYMSRKENDKFYAELTQALWGYLSDKLSIPSSQLLRDNVAEKLQQYGASEDSINKIINILDTCEMARYTPEHSESEISDLYNESVSVIKSIENVKR